MIAYVALMVYKVTGDEEFLHEVYSPMWKYYDWLLKERDHDGDYLLTIIHPWESGWDASPRWDDLLGLSDPTDDEARQARFALAHKLKGVGYDMSGVIQENLFHVEPVDFNAIYSANTLALARIAAIIGRQDHEVYFKTIAHKVAAAIRAKMWDERAGSYWDLAGIHEKPIEIPTPASFITLFAEIPPRTQADRLIDQMLTHFSAIYPVPTVAVDHPAFAPAQYWRGSTWLNVNWLIVHGLRQYGFTEVARSIVRQSIALIDREGFREYYDSFTGRGLGAQSHSWSGLVLDMVES
jgi:neutral trehalase